VKQLWQLFYLSVAKANRSKLLSSSHQYKSTGVNFRSIGEATTNWYVIHFCLNTANGTFFCIDVCELISECFRGHSFTIPTQNVIIKFELAMMKNLLGMAKEKKQAQPNIPAQNKMMFQPGKRMAYDEYSEEGELVD